MKTSPLFSTDIYRPRLWRTSVRECLRHRDARFKQCCREPVFKKRASWPSLRPRDGADGGERRIWTTTVRRGHKRAIKRGQTEGTRRGLGKHTLTRSASLTPFTAHSFTFLRCLSSLQPPDQSWSNPSAFKLSPCSSAVTPPPRQRQEPH